jgi:hypothetical protein
MTPELKAFRYYRKNIDRFLEEMACFWGNNEKLREAYDGIAAKFGADGSKLMDIVQISYRRSVERSFGQKSKS